jgi:GGDEF domain-containing protein
VAATSRRLKNCLGNDIEIARIGADDFAILLPNIQESSQAIAAADLTHQAMEDPFPLCDRPMVFSTASIGIVMSHIGYQTPEKFLTAAGDGCTMPNSKDREKPRYLIHKSNAAQLNRSNYNKLISNTAFN